MADLHYQCAWTWKPPSRHTHRGCLWGCLTKVGGLTLEQHPMDWGPEWMQQRKSESWTPTSPTPLLLLLHCRHNVTQTFLLWQSTSSDGELNIQVSFLRLSIYLCIFTYVCVCLSKCHTYTGTCRNQKSVLDSLEVELQMCCPMWVLGAELGSSTSWETSALNYRAIPTTLKLFLPCVVTQLFIP